MIIRYEELAKLYGQYAAVVRQAEDGFKESVKQMLDSLREAVSELAGEKVKEKVTGEGRIYRYWALGSFEKPHVWLWTKDARIVSPGELKLRAWAGDNPSKEVIASVMSISEREDIGPLAEQPGPQAIFSVLYESQDGQPLDELAAKVAKLLSLLRDAASA